MFNFLKRKKPGVAFKDFDFKDAFEKVYKFLSEKFKDDFDAAKKDFVNLTGHFDEEDVFFNNKLEDFRHWFVFLYKREANNDGLLFEAQDFEEVKPFYHGLSSGSSGLFEVVKVKGDFVFLKNLFTSEKIKVSDHIKALSLEAGGVIQTALFQTSEGVYTFGVSILYHPKEAKSYILKKVKTISKESEGAREKSEFEFLNKLMVSRYQLFRYKQVAIDKIYSEKSLIKKTGQ